MPRQISPPKFIVFAATVVVLTYVIALLLPHQPYIRFQQLASESVHYLRVKWIYERIHFDKTPIDVAFIGTSHTQSGINSEKVEQVIQRKGNNIHVVNFSVPHLGRDLQFLILRELIENRKVQKVVIELQEAEARAPHPGFQRLALVEDIFKSPVVINSGIFENISRLPLRQIQLLLRSIEPRFFGLVGQFDPGSYEGAHWDDTYKLHGIDIPRTKANSREELQQAAVQLQKQFEKKQLVARKLWLPNMRYSLVERYNYLYLDAMLDLASSHGVEVVFLYLPYYQGPKMPIGHEYLVTKGRVIVPYEVFSTSSYWQNVDHLNFSGANYLSVWVGETLSSRN